jgi:hypothetical protein
MHRFAEIINEQDTLRESNPIQTESDLTHHVHPFWTLKSSFTREGSPESQDWLGILQIALFNSIQAQCGPRLAIPPGTGSERSHNGFRDHSYCEQHPTGGVHLFCRDSDLARLGGGNAAMEKSQISYLKDDASGYLISQVSYLRYEKSV